MEYWDNDEWINFSRHTYTYNEAGNLLTDLQEYFVNKYVSNIHTYSDDEAIAGKIICSKTKSALIELKQISRLQAGLPISLGFLTANLK